MRMDVPGTTNGLQFWRVGAPLVQFCALAAVGLTPLRDPFSLRATMIAGLFLLLILSCLAAKTFRAGLGVMIALAVGAYLGWDNHLILLIGLVPAVLIANNSAIQLLAIASCTLIIGSVRKTFDPGLVDIAPGFIVEAITPDALVKCSVSPAVYGAAAIFIALALQIPRMQTWRGCLAAVGVIMAMLLAAVIGRVRESAWPIFIAILGVSAIAPVFSERQLSAKGVTSRTPWYRTAAITIVTLIAALAMGTSLGTSDGRTSVKTIGMIGAMHGSFEPEPLPTSDRTQQQARFGHFRRLLVAQGFRVIDVPSPTATELSSCDAFVTINFSGAQADLFIAPLRREISRGARLLVLADHTHMFGQGKLTNDLLAGTGIRLSFDSAVPRGINSSWQGAIDVSRDPLFGPTPKCSAIPWSVGCSLTVERPARSLARATYAFLDDGDASKPGGLGNLQRAPAETFGGFPIAASSKLDHGRVLVFGDTSALQDVSIAVGSQFASRVGAWLGGVASVTSIGGSLPLLGLSIFTAVLILPSMLKALSNRDLVCLLTILCVAEGASSAFLSDVKNGLEVSSVPRMIIDKGVFPVLGNTYADGRPSPLFREALLRGQLPLISERTADLRPTDCLIFIDPARRLDQRDQLQLDEFVRNGGRLAVFIGPRGAVSMDTLFAAWGIKLGPVLGTGAEDSRWAGYLKAQKGKPRFYACYALMGPGIEDSEVLAYVFDRPAALLRTHGKGKILVVADPIVPSDRHCEKRYGGTIAGIQTLSHLLDALLQQ